MTRLPDELASNLIVRMVLEYEDEESDDGEPDAEDAFAVAIDEYHDDVPEGFGSDRIAEDLADRGWVRIERSEVHEVGNEMPLAGPVDITEITVAGFAHARSVSPPEGPRVPRETKTTSIAARVPPDFRRLPTSWGSFRASGRSVSTS